MPSLTERVETAADTELSRLGSAKLLLSATSADVSTASVAGVVIATLDAGADSLQAWAADADGDTETALEAAASRYADTRAAALDAWPDADARAAQLVDLPAETHIDAQVGAGLVGLPLVLDRLFLQSVSFHVNEANTAAADILRDIREDVSEIPNRAANLADAGAVDEEAVVEGALAVVEAAYEQYADRLADMGLDPKPLC